MRKSACVGVVGFVLAGCAGAYDGRALPAAASAEQLAVAQCAQQAPGTAADGMKCLIEADRKFVVAIKLRDMSLFDNYAARLTILGADVDAKKVSDSDAFAQLNGIRDDFSNSVNQEAAQSAAQNAALAGAMMGMSQSMQASQNAAAAAYRPPVTCSSYRLGNTVQTNCN